MTDISLMSVEDLRVELEMLRDALAQTFQALGASQGAAIGACCQIIYEQLQDPQLPIENLKFTLQQLDAITKIAQAMVEAKEARTH